MNSEASQPDDPLLDAPADEIQYRSLSALAVVALLLGILSLLALLSPILWIIPACAVAVGALALRAIYQDSQKTGERLAKIGMLLAVTVGLWAASYHFAREWYLFHTAKKFADQWLEVVQGGDLM